MKIYTIRRIVHEWYEVEADSREEALRAMEGDGQPDPYYVDVKSERVAQELTVSYETCPVCGQQGWKSWQTRIYRGHECRYCRARIIEFMRRAHEPVWDPIPKARIHRELPAAKEES